MNLKCVVGRHNWFYDCEECYECGKTRTGAHSWNGCKCTKCYQTRDETRDEGHDWTEDCEKCKHCGKIRKGAHTWHEKSCSACGKTPVGLSWNECAPIAGTYKCQECDKSNSNRSFSNFARASDRGDALSMVAIVMEDLENTPRVERTAGQKLGICPKCGRSASWNWA